MSGDIPQSPNTPSWRGAQLKYRDISTFTLHKMKTESKRRDLGEEKLNEVGAKLKYSRRKSLRHLGFLANMLSGPQKYDLYLR
jgi:hypothetical protein